MATVKKMVKKAQRGADVKKSLKTADSLRYATPKIGPGGPKEVMAKRASNKAKADSIEKAVEKRVGVPRKLNMYEQKFGGVTKKTKAKSGGSFPDLNKDGKVTKADILKGRGVIAKKGAKVSATKKCKYGCK